MTKPENWTPESEVDPLNGASIKSRSRMAQLLKISERQLDRLTLAGKLPIRPDGWFHVRETIDAYAEYLAVKASRPSRHDGARDKQAALLQRRFDREGETLIDTADALQTVDIVTKAFVLALESLPAQIADDRDELARIQLIVGNVVARMQDRFSVERLALATGKRGLA